MSGECFEHDLQWYSGGIECPLCALASERDRLREALKNLSESREIDNCPQGIAWQNGFNTMVRGLQVVARAALDKDA